MTLFESIKEAVTAYDAAVYSGMKPNQSGMVCCPFHKDKHPSMKLGKRYYCFGCGAHGDAVDFVANLYGLSLKDAAMKLIQDFHISYDNSRPSSVEEMRIRYNRNEARLEAEQIRDLCNRLGNLHSFLRKEKSYMNDFIYVDYLYEYYILNSTSEIRKKEYENVLKEVIRIERKYEEIENHRGSKSDAGSLGKGMAV